MDMEALVAEVKASRASRGLKSTYVGHDGKPFDMFHASPAHKAFYDFKYALLAKYPTEADVPHDDMVVLRRLHAAMRKSA